MITILIEKYNEIVSIIYIHIYIYVFKFHYKNDLRPTTTLDEY